MYYRESDSNKQKYVHTQVRLYKDMDRGILLYIYIYILVYNHIVTYPITNKTQINTTRETHQESNKASHVLVHIYKYKQTKIYQDNHINKNKTITKHNIH